jgi:hypothetical protein
LTQERFNRLLDNPDLLTTLSYEELKTLALTYPYAHNLRYLLALKARQDEHPDADRMLTSASFYSLDRTQLFLLTSVKVSFVQPVAVALDEVVLELKPIELVQRELEARAPQQRVAQVEAPVVQVEATATPQPAMPETPVADETIAAPAAPEIPEEPALPEAEIEEASPGEAAAAEEKDSDLAVVAPPPAQPFALWYGQFNPPVLAPPAPPATEVPQEEPEPESPLKDLSAQELAERSVTENKDVISETLARLLVRQGYRDKAIAMYERLCLAIPEKSAYFAAEIEKLKK